MKGNMLEDFGPEITRDVERDMQFLEDVRYAMAYYFNRADILGKEVFVCNGWRAERSMRHVLKMRDWLLQSHKPIIEVKRIMRNATY